MLIDSFPSPGSSDPRMDELATRRARYNNRSAASKIIAHLTGNVLHPRDKELLRRHELGSVGRVFEDAASAIDSARRLDVTHHTAEISPITDLLPVTTIGSILIGRGSFDRFDGVVDLMSASGVQVDGIKSIGVFTDRYDTDYQGRPLGRTRFGGFTDLTREATSLPYVGLHGFDSDLRSVDSLELTRGAIGSMPQGDQELIGQFCQAITRDTNIMYLRSRPENVG